ncbi:MAG: hypothetical protein LBI30_01430 [Holosporales bacterium]|jgi:hypothetical protein|nr:hypothetical protein [Holosporales bacterium]
MRISFSEFSIENLLSKRFLFVYGNNQSLQRKFLDFIVAATKLSDKSISAQSVLAKALDIKLDENILLFQEQVVKLHIVEKVGDGFIPRLNEVFSSPDIFVLAADSYKQSKKISELLMKNQSCECLGFFNNDNKVVLDLARMICKIAMVDQIPSFELVRFATKKMDQSDTNIASIMFYIQMLGNDQDVSDQMGDSSLTELICGMEAISAIRFYTGSLCRKIDKDNDSAGKQSKIVEKLWRLEKKIKTSSPIDPIIAKTTIYQSVLASSVMEKSNS